MPATVGLIGLGAMGLPVARNLVARGFTVAGFDVRAAAVDSLAEAGGVRVGSAKEASRHADFLLLMVVNAAQAEQVLFSDGALDALAPNSIVVLMATCPPGVVEALAARVLAAGRRFVDAPVSGGVVGATGATLTIMAAAPHETFSAAKPLLEALGDKIFHVGERPGQGAVVKAVNQLLCGVHLTAVAEAFSLAAKLGVDLKVLLEILGGSSASSWMLRDRGPRMLQACPEVTRAVDIFVKDLGIVLTRISHKAKMRRAANAKIQRGSRHLLETCVQAAKNSVFSACVRIAPAWFGNMLNELANYPTRHRSRVGVRYAG